MFSGRQTVHSVKVNDIGGMTANATKVNKWIRIVRNESPHSLPALAALLPMALQFLLRPLPQLLAQLLILRQP